MQDHYHAPPRPNNRWRTASLDHPRPNTRPTRTQACPGIEGRKSSLPRQAYPGIEGRKSSLPGPSSLLSCRTITTLHPDLTTAGGRPPSITPDLTPDLPGPRLVQE